MRRTNVEIVMVVSTSSIGDKAACRFDDQVEVVLKLATPVQFVPPLGSTLFFLVCQ
jgi:hypothetical protein